MMTTLFADKVTQLLANESPSVQWNIALGDDNSSPALLTTTTMDNEIDRVSATLTSSSTKGTWTSIITEADTSLNNQTFKELGVFDADSSGNMVARVADFTTFNTRNTHETIIEIDTNLVASSETDSNKLTTVGISKIYDLLKGNSTDYPTHVGFSTRLILDTLNATTDWTATGGAVATSENRQEGTHSIALTKSTGATTVSMAKTLSSSVDASSAETLNLWVRPNSLTTLNTFTTSNCLTIRIGSDSSNYIQLQADKADLSTSWRILSLNLSDATTTGSPVMTAIDYLYIGITTNNSTDVWTGEELLFDFINLDWDTSTSDTTLHEEIIRKAISTIDYVYNSVRYRGLLSTSEGNTYNYYYTGLFDSASSGDMFAVNKLYLTTKDSSRQLNFFIELVVRFE